MKSYSTPLALAKQLIRLPSYVSDIQDETPAQEFVEEYTRSYLPQMSVTRQYLLDSTRYNLIIKGSQAPKLLVLAHIDTVQPKDGWLTDPLLPIVKNGSLYGLGAADMKSSLAAFLWTLAQPEQQSIRDSVILLVYGDEEYDFKGMQRFMADDLSGIAPVMTLSLDGGLEVSTGCRGVIELNLTIQGLSGHASNPANGVNVITQTVEALQVVSDQLAAYRDPILGAATANLAAFTGGTLMTFDGQSIWAREGNVIPDRAEVVFEVRTPVAELTAQCVLERITAALAARNLQLVDSAIRHNIAPWPAVDDTKFLSMLQFVYIQAGVPFQRADETLRGYIDAQMVAERIAAPTCIIGTGGSNKHGANENVALQDIDRAARIYEALLRRLSL